MMRKSNWRVAGVALVVAGAAWMASADKQDCKIKCSTTYFEETKNCPPASASDVAAAQCQEDAKKRYDQCTKGCGK